MFASMNNDEIKEKMHKQWLEAGPGYSEVVLHGTFMPQVHAAFVDSLTPLLYDKGEVNVLDVAAASGEPSLSLAAALPNAKIIATDLAESYLPLGRAQAEAAGLSNQVSFEAADGENLVKFADNSFDVVTCSLGLMFFPNESKGLREFYRVLKPNGILAVTVWGTHVPFFTKLKEVAKKITPPEAAPPNTPGDISQRFGDGKGLCELITKSGFTDLDHRELNITFKLNNDETRGDWFDQLWKTPLPLKAAVIQAVQIPGHENAKEEAKALLAAEYGDWASSERRQLIQGQTIINEDVTNIPISDRWPYTVALGVCTDGTPTSVICGATLIHPYVVLTAAHCLKSRNDAQLPPPSAVCIVHGATNMTEGLLNYKDYTVISSKEYVIHPSYKQVDEFGEFHITGDIALLFLNEPILEPARPESWIASHSSNPGYALLPNPNQKWDRFNFAFFGVTIGWGITENATRTYNQAGDPEPQRLDAERITFQVAMSPEECKSQPFFFGMQNQPNDTFCGAWFGGFEQIFGGGDDEIVSTICKGDSGGALVIPSTIVDPFGFQGDVQIGIVSAGPACPYTPFNESLVWPAEYVDVSQYVPWIHDEMKARGYTPLQVATNPLGRAYKNQTCFPGNCYAENVMANVLASSAAGMVDVKMASLVGILAAFAVF